MQKRKVLKIKTARVFDCPTSCIKLTEKDGSILLTQSAKPLPYEKKLKNVAVLFSGGPAPGGHNCIAGIYDAINRHSRVSTLYGCLQGSAGLLSGNFRTITKGVVEKYFNTGGFDMLGTSRIKIEKKEQFDKIAEVCDENEINAIIIIGGDDSNTNAWSLADYYKGQGLDISVIGIPKTIDADMQNEKIEITFGFDSACDVYSSLISNIQSDCFSMKKYYHFIKLMGRQASWIALESALRTIPTWTLISEEIKSKSMSLRDCIENLAELIGKRKEQAKNYGVILIPEGILEFTTDVSPLIQEINRIKKEENLSDMEAIKERLSDSSLNTLNYIPKIYQNALFAKTDSHGNIQLSSIESEKIIATKLKEYFKNESFDYQTHFFGYEGRSCAPTVFDASYCYNLGWTALLLSFFRKTGYVSFVGNLRGKERHWQVGGYDLSKMVEEESRSGKTLRVIKKSLVDVNSSYFEKFKDLRLRGLMEDNSPKLFQNSCWHRDHS